MQLGLLLCCCATFAVAQDGSTIAAGNISSQEAGEQTNSEQMIHTDDKGEQAGSEAKGEDTGMSTDEDPAATWKYEKMTYGSILANLTALAKLHPDLVEYGHQYEFGDLKPLTCWNDLNSQEGLCEYPVVRVSWRNESFVNNDQPGVMISGTLHGDERLGAVVSYHLVQELTTPQVLEVYELYRIWLLKNRDLWVLPFANAEGYSHNSRLERNYDPNRDFPYQATKCFQTNAAKVIDTVAHHKIFLAGITFHGGMRSLTYNWGSPNHVQVHQGKQISTECPDLMSQIRVAQALQKAAGIFPTKVLDPS